MASAAQSTRVTRLEDKAFGAGVSTQIQTAGMVSPGRRILQVVFRLDCDLTQPGAGQAAQLGGVLHQLVANFKIGRRVSITGYMLRLLNWFMTGREVNFPAGFPATAGGVFSRSIVWVLNYQDPSAESPDDGAVASELWQDPIEVTFGSPTAIFLATAPTVAGTLRTYVVHDADSGVAIGQRDVPASLNIQSEGPFTSLTVPILKAGKWVYVVAGREAQNDAGAITSANVTSFTSNIDGEPIWNNVRGQDAASVYNALRADGAAIEFESQTAPIGGELINDEPGFAAAAGSAVSMNFLGLLGPPDKYRMTQVPTAELGFRLDIQGTLTGYKLAYRIVEPRPDSAIAAAARKIGMSDASVNPKTGDGKVLSIPGVSAYIPARLKALMRK
jgi:hypothetical protein